MLVHLVVIRTKLPFLANQQGDVSPSPKSAHVMCDDHSHMSTGTLSLSLSLSLSFFLSFSLSLFLSSASTVDCVFYISLHQYCVLLTACSRDACLFHVDANRQQPRQELHRGGRPFSRVHAPADWIRVRCTLFLSFFLFTVSLSLLLPLFSLLPLSSLSWALHDPHRVILMPKTR